MSKITKVIKVAETLKQSKVGIFRIPKNPEKSKAKQSKVDSKNPKFRPKAKQSKAKQSCEKQDGIPDIDTSSKTGDTIQG